MSVNKVILLGNLGHQPELKYTNNGAAVTTISIATNDALKDTEGKTHQRAQWHRVVLWKRLAEIAGEYLHKGSKVYVEGRLQTRYWEDKDGNKRYSTEVVAYRLKMLNGKKTSEPSASDEQGKEANRRKK